MGTLFLAWRLPFVGAVVLTFLTSCSSSSIPTSADAEQLLRSARLSDHQAVIQVDRLLDTQAGADAARKLLTAGASGDPRWFAIYVYANSGSDPAPLQPLLADHDAAVRVVAASALVRLGDAAGFPVLIDSLTHTETLPASSPPSPVWVVATETLARTIGDGTLGPPFDADAYRRRIAHERWSVWFTANRGRLHFDAGSGDWNVK